MTLTASQVTQAILCQRDFYRGKLGPPRHARSLCLPRFTPPRWMEADVWEVGENGLAKEFEVKLSRADFRVDRLKEQGGERKHARLSLGDPNGPSRFLYVVPEGLRIRDLLPDFAGLVEVRRDWTLRQVIKAPRLHRQPVADEVRQQMLRACYARYHRLLSLRHVLDVSEEEKEGTPSPAQATELAPKEPTGED